MSCGNCKYWRFEGKNLKGFPYGECDAIGMDAWNRTTDLAFLSIAVDDDTGLEAALITQEQFSCALFIRKG